MSKKIIAILETDPEVGGEHQYASVIMDSLKEITRDHIELLAICNNGYWRRWCRENNVRILQVSWPAFTEKEQYYNLRHPIFSRIYSMYMTELGGFLRKEKINAILSTAQGLFIPNLNIKVIAPVHDLMHRYEGDFKEVRENYNARELVFASKAQYAWCVLTDSKLGRTQFIESYSDYMKTKMPNIISLPFVVPKHIVECKEEFIEVPEKYVFYPAQFWKHKNHLNLIKAIQILIKDLPDIHLVLVGTEKNSMREIKHYISDNKLENNIIIKGFVSNGNITYLYKHALGMIMPSYFGPTNIPPLEAMALGCPVAVANKYAMPEQVGDAGLQFDPDSPEEMADCIRKIWCNNSLRQEMIRKGYIRVNKWTKEGFCNKLQRIIDKI